MLSGEAQRIRLATKSVQHFQEFSIFLDEPSIGHQRINDRLIESLKSMKWPKEAAIVVEHDRRPMRAADYDWYREIKLRVNLIAFELSLLSKRSGERMRNHWQDNI